LKLDDLGPQLPQPVREGARLLLECPCLFGFVAGQGARGFDLHLALGLYLHPLDCRLHLGEVRLEPAQEAISFGEG
jgi:hypothetical protein